MGVMLEFRKKEGLGNHALKLRFCLASVPMHVASCLHWLESVLQVEVKVSFYPIDGFVVHTPCVTTPEDIIVIRASKLPSSLTLLLLHDLVMQNALANFDFFSSILPLYFHIQGIPNSGSERFDVWLVFA